MNIMLATAERTCPSPGHYNPTRRNRRAPSFLCAAVGIRAADVNADNYGCFKPLPRVPPGTATSLPSERCSPLPTNHSRSLRATRVHSLKPPRPQRKRRPKIAGSAILRRSKPPYRFVLVRRNAKSDSKEISQAVLGPPQLRAGERTAPAGASSAFTQRAALIVRTPRAGVQCA
jgi:hypothetical protein